MNKSKRSLGRKWIISLLELKDYEGEKFKVTRSIPALRVHETKIFGTKEEAKRQFEEWLK